MRSSYTYYYIYRQGLEIGYALHLLCACELRRQQHVVQPCCDEEIVATMQTTELHSSTGVCEDYEFGTIHLRGVTVVVVVVEQRSAAKQFHCFLRSAVGSGSVGMAAQQTASLRSLRAEETAQRLGFHAVDIALVVGFFGHSVYHDQLFAHASHKSAVGEMASAVGCRHHPTLNRSAFAQDDVAFTAHLGNRIGDDSRLVLPAMVAGAEHDCYDCGQYFAYDCFHVVHDMFANIRVFLLCSKSFTPNIMHVSPKNAIFAI